MYPHPLRMATEARAEVATASTRAVGAWQCVVGSTQVNRCSAVTWNKPKVLTGLDQKVSGQVRVLRTHPAQMSSHRRTGGT